MLQDNNKVVRYSYSFSNISDSISSFDVFIMLFFL